LNQQAEFMKVYGLAVTAI